MKDYVKVIFSLSPCNEDMTDLLAAFLADIGYESFVAEDSGMSGYIQSEEFSEASFKEIIESFPFETSISYEYEIEKGRDWNEEWEKNYFHPIVIADRCVIHSTFHKDVPEAEYDIVIDPKMAFGTGHHATTSMMVGHLLSKDLKGKTIIDMGTGTGILAILSMMRGAKEIYGIEIDPSAADNARENVGLNRKHECSTGGKIEIITGNSSSLKDLHKADIFLANINRNVILADMSVYVESLASGGELILSGFYESDIPMLARAAELYGLNLKDKIVGNDKWSSVVFNKI